MTPRPYRDRRDWKRICDLLIEGRQAGTGTYYPHIGDLSWWIYHPDVMTWTAPADFELGLRERIFIFEDGQRLVGCGVFPPEGGIFGVFTDPNECGISTEEKIFAWAEDHLRRLEPGSASTSQGWISERDKRRADLLARRGYEVAPQFALQMTCALDQVVAPEPPRGFTLRHLAGENEIELRSTTMRAAFHSPLPMTHHVDRYRRFMRSPVYVREHDLIAIAPDASAAGCGMIWCDAVNRVGLFEPFGTRPDFQGQGVGAALMRYGLSQLRERGMGVAIVCPNGDNQAAIGLYESVGFHSTDRLLTYSKSG